MLCTALPLDVLACGLRKDVHSFHRRNRGLPLGIKAYMLAIQERA